MFDVKAFRTALPEFADTAIYPDPMVQLWGDFATSMVNARRWGNQASMGIRLYTAHWVTIEGKNLEAASMGGTPGQTSGPINSKTVGPVTVAYDTQAAVEADAGSWNLTTYGKQFIRLARLFGAGVIQV